MCRSTNSIFSFILLFLIAIISGDTTLEYNSGNLLEDKFIKQKLNLLNSRNLVTNYAVSSDYNSTHNEDDKCNRDLDLVLKGFMSQEIWALKMFDSSSKIPSGLLVGNMYDLGMYDECISVRGITEGIEIRGRYCIYNIVLSLNANQSLNLMQSICMPARCDGKDVVDLLNNTFTSASQQQNFQIRILSASCSSISHKVWDMEFTICFFLLIIFIIFLVGCTVCDVIQNWLYPNGEHRHIVITILSQFSLSRSVRSILNTEVKEGNLPTIHGIRFLSMAWVVLGHEFQIHAMGANVNTLDVFNWVKSWKSLYIFTATFAVDTFFALSGFLMTYVFLKTMPKQRKFNVLMYYLHRYIRLTPAVIALLVIATVFVPKMSPSLIWEMTMNNFVNQCRKQWWYNIFYLQNFSEDHAQCLGHLWYLAADMQLFLISPIILYPLYKKPKVGLLIILALFLVNFVSIATIVGVTKHHTFSIDLRPDPTIKTNVFTNIEYTPYNRAGAWLVGILFGYEVATKRRENNRFALRTGWFLTAGAFFFCVYGIRSFMEADYEYNIIWEIIFLALSRPLWAFCVGWIIYASTYNYAGPISSILCWKLFVPLSKISYCVYLVHMLIQVMNAGAMRTLNYFSEYFVWHDYFGDLIICIIVGFGLSLLFEAPVMVLEKMLFQRKRANHRESQNELKQEKD